MTQNKSRQDEGRQEEGRQEKGFDNTLQSKSVVEKSKKALSDDGKMLQMTATDSSDTMRKDTAIEGHSAVTVGVVGGEAAVTVGIVGGGAAGMISAIFALRGGSKVVLFEKNEKLGKKIYITGKGRCNLTNTANVSQMQDNIVSNPKFMMSGLNSFDSSKTVAFFEELGLRTKVERGGRVFPESEKASDVTKVMQREIERLGGKILFNTKVTGVAIKERVKDKNMFSIKTEDGKNFLFNKVIIATGGLSYPSTGSDGDGYRFAKDFGHNITPLNPSLVGFVLEEKEICKCAGLTLKNVGVKLIDQEKSIKCEFGELLITHSGVSGPTVLTLSSFAAKTIAKAKLSVEIDLKPALDEAELDKRVYADFLMYSNKTLANALKDLLPASLIPEFIEKAGLNSEKKVNILTKDERKKVVKTLKAMRFTIERLGGFNEAVITSGGVDVSHINPKTFESKLVGGLYFCGEMIDVDALTGGFNLQIAFSSGFLAGNNASRD